MFLTGPPVYVHVYMHGQHRCVPHPRTPPTVHVNVNVNVNVRSQTF